MKRPQPRRADRSRQAVAAIIAAELVTLGICVLLRWWPRW